ncbi:MAG: NAD(P)/FAD-dependent oxidoreductase [Oligoflexia bacterium]|nr:NAD(P)/FAD-dependent oxidoreductase [Oligoflexia bacterium]
MTDLAIPTASTRDRVKTPNPDKVDVAIIGAGLGGLMAGAILSLRGQRVAVFDGHYVAGGCATMFHRTTRDGTYQFDIGLHYIGDCQPGGKIPSLLAQVGVELDYIPMDQDGFDTIVLPELSFPIPADRDRYRDRLVEHFPAQVRGIDRYVRLLCEVDHMVGVMDRGTHGLVGTAGLLWNVATKARLLPRYMRATMAQVLDDCTDDPVLRAVICGQNGDYGLPPSRVSALLHMGLANHYFKGAWYPKGGGQVIADHLARVIEDHGGSICLRRPIDQILVKDGRACGVRVAPRRQDPHNVLAHSVISNADIKQTLSQLLPQQHLSPQWWRRTQNFQMGGAIFITCLGIRGDLRDLGMRARNTWCFDSSDIESVYSDIARGRLEPRAVYITSASLKDPDTHGHTPPGVMGVEVMCLSPGRAEAWGVPADQVESGEYRKSPVYLAHKLAVEDALIDRLDRQFPGARDRVVFRESASPVTHSRYTRATDGTGYGLAATPDQFMKGRPGTRGPVPGLYLAGASTRAGHGIVGAMSSGQQAARRVLKDRG